MKALITGCLGQDGSYLAEHLLSLGYEVWGTVRRIRPGITPTLFDADDSGNWVAGVDYYYADMTDIVSVDKVIRKCWPDEIYNLAGQVFVPTSWNYPAETFDVNTGGLARIMKVLEETKCKAKVYQASTSEMFGNQLTYLMEKGIVSLNEKSIMHPVSPYGVSKLAAHKLVDVYRQKGMYIVSGILGNHESPRRGEEMVTRKITKHVAKWRRETSGAFGIGCATLKLGNLQSKRDWGFAGDYVKAMHLMLQQEQPDDYVIGTGEAHSVQEFLEAALEAAQLDLFSWPEHVEIDPAFSRSEELHTLVLDASKAKRILGWKSETTFKQLVTMMVNSDVYSLPEGAQCIAR
jgi:GDPmannose 4,6-dehydratase